MMKVCFFVSNLISGGVERTVAYVSEYFAKQGIDTTILSLSNEIFYDIKEPVKLVSLNIPRSYSNIIEKYYRIYLRLTGVKKNLKKEKYDIVFCMAPEMSRYILPFFKKNAFEFRLISSERNNPLFDTANNKRIKEKLFPVCDGIVFQTQRAMECFSKDIQEKSIVIPNAVGNELSYSIQAPLQKKKKFAAVGRLTKQKDYETMIKAFSLFYKDYSDFSLDIYGIGEDEDVLKKLSADLGVSQAVHFLGVCKDALLQIADAQAFLLSSIYEGMPNVLLEAMAIGMPCISTDCPFGPKELIEDGVNGLLTPVGDADSFYLAMKKYVDNPNFANQCGQNAKSVIQSFSINEISQRYLQYVQEINNL